MEPTNVRHQERDLLRIPQGIEKEFQKAFEDKSFEFVKIKKILIQIQHELSAAWKVDAPVEEIKVFIQIHFQYQQWVREQTPATQFNEISSRINRLSDGTNIAALANIRPN